MVDRILVSAPHLVNPEYNIALGSGWAAPVKAKERKKDIEIASRINTHD